MCVTKELRYESNTKHMIKLNQEIVCLTQQKKIDCIIVFYSLMDPFEFLDFNFNLMIKIYFYNNSEVEMKWTVSNISKVYIVINFQKEYVLKKKS